jgi:winged helix DNA-binding protein
MRLKIMPALSVLSPDAQLEFTRLKGLVGATDGNGAHLETLAKAGYVAIQRLFVGKKPQTRVKPTPAGRRAFSEHLAYLREILDGGAPP